MENLVTFMDVKKVVIFAVVIFLIGSALSGASWNIMALIIFRGLQGIGGGGLFALIFIIMSEVVTIRERGKYQGILGATFTFSSIIGPFVGGVFTDKISWRWAFYINLPIGAVALFIIIYKLKLPPLKVKAYAKNIDIFGIATLVIAIVCLLLALTWGGITYPWDSGIVIGLLVASGVLTILFIIIEFKFAKEPVIPLSLFRYRNFTLTTIIGFLIGWSMMSVFSFMPTYLQVVYQLSATGSGIQTFPLAFSMPVSGIITGIIVSKTGRYRIFPILGCAVMALSFYLYSTFTEEFNVGMISGYMTIMGIGIGLVMQILVLIAQNAVPQADIAICTTTVTFVRQLGGVFGIAIFGTLITNFVNSKLASIGINIADFSNNNSGVVSQLPQFVIDAYYYAYTRVFFYGFPFAAVAMLFAFFVQHLVLRSTLGTKPKDVEMATKATNENNGLTKPNDIEVITNACNENNQNDVVNNENNGTIIPVNTPNGGKLEEQPPPYEVIAPTQPSVTQESEVRNIVNTVEGAI
jgi:EmrB/QacA subfamily drug resistance transporter